MSNEIVYGFSDCRFGDIIVARTEQGVCDLQFLDFNRLETIHELAERWGEYTPTTQDDDMAHTVSRVAFGQLNHPLQLDLRGHRVSTSRVAGGAENTLRADALLPRGGRGHRGAYGGARRGHGHCAEPHSRTGAMPPRDTQRRDLRRVPLGARPEAPPHRMGEGSGRQKPTVDLRQA